MKKAVVIILLAIIAICIAGYFASRNLDWNTIDYSGVPVTVSPSAHYANNKTLYVRCALDGASYVLPEKQCAAAKRQRVEMAP